MSSADIQELIAALNKELNTGRPRGTPEISFVRTADDVTNPFLLRRPTGITSLDVALGGGWPAGGISQIAGIDGAGKNALCWQTLAKVQEIYGEESAIGWCWTEYPLDKEFARQFGVVIPMSDMDIELENMARKRDGRQKLSKKEIKKRRQSLGEFIVIDKGSTEKRLQAVVEMVRSNLFQVIVVDSLGALLTEVQDEADLDENPQMSSEARLVTRFQQKLWGAYGDPDDGGDVNWTSVLAINQVRANMSTAKYKKEWKVAGAHALRHGKLMDVWISKKERIPKDKKKEAEGRVVGWELAKAKAGAHDGPIGTIDYRYDTGFDLAEDLIDTAKQTGILMQSGSKYLLVDENGEVIQDDLPGTAGLIKQAVTDDEWAQVVYELVLKKEDVSCFFKHE